MSPEIGHVFLLAIEAVILASLVLLRREYKKGFSQAIRELAREICESILRDEIDRLKAQVASARKLNLPHDSSDC